MEHAISVGAVVGTCAAIPLVHGWHLSFLGLVLAGSLSGIAGGLIGMCLALTWATEAPERPTAPRDLWDPWLDAGTVPGDADREPAVSVEAAATTAAGEFALLRGRVRPRVFAPETSEALLLLDVIGPIFANRSGGIIRLVGPPGSGKTTALDYLAGTLPPYLSVTFLDDPDPSAIVGATARGWVVSTSSSASVLNTFPDIPTILRLAPWGKDEWIEYLLASDRQACASVMARLADAEAEAERLDGIPELWRVVLDRMMADQSISGPFMALRSELATLLSDPEYRGLVEAYCFAQACDQAAQREAGVRIIPAPGDPRHYVEILRRGDPDRALFRLIRHRQVQLLLAADWIAASIKRRAESETLSEQLPRDLVIETAARIAVDSQAVERLNSLVTGHDRTLHPMAASILHALRIGWEPGTPLPRLAGAYLAEASWPDLNLTIADTQGVDLSAANLSGSQLDRANLEGARLVGADLCAASMDGATLDSADLSRAHLTQARAVGASFRSAQLAGANLVRANLDQAVLVGADLTRARLADASLVRANLRSAMILGADFSRANLTGAILHGLRLAGVQFAGTCFKRADLSRCDLEGMVLPGAAFQDANLQEALLTGSCMRSAELRGACLQRAGLADVDWVGADLREADLRQAAFHLGSSRSGLVGSPIACEGSRTGFYTDDYDEQTYKSPEEIRKANLCGADLRGARIDEVDFYLVDLRGARLDPHQIPQIRHCGAILEART